MTILSLEEFREIIGFHNFHFWQLAANEGPVMLNSACNTLVLERAFYFSDRAGRVEILQAIDRAEKKITEWLNFAPGPVYKSETIWIGCIYHNPPSLLETSLLKLRAIQTETRTLFQSVGVTYSDENGDGVEDTFTGLISDSTLTDFSMLECAFAQADLQPINRKNLDNYLIRPVLFNRVSPSLIEVLGAKPLLCKPLLREQIPIWAGYDPGNGPAVNTSGAISATDPASFVPSVDVYQRVVTNQNKVELITIDSSGVEQTTLLDARILSSDFGQVKINPGGNCVACSCGKTPSKIKINYRSGDELENWKETIVHLALAYLSRNFCACNAGNAEVMRWAFDGARGRGRLDEQFQISNDDLNNPLGTRMGQIYAWKDIKSKRIIRGFSIS